MITEFQARAQMAAVLSSEATPHQKVKALLRIAIQIRNHAATLEGTRQLATIGNNPNTHSHMERLLQSLRMLHDEVRLAAWAILIHEPVREAASV